VQLEEFDMKRPNHTLLMVVVASCALVATAATGLGSAQQTDKIPGAVTAAFGLKMGMTLAELKAITTFNPVQKTSGGYQAESLPNGDAAEFRSYGFFVSPKQGLCKVFGIGKTVDTGSDGSDLRMVFQRVEDRLKAKYGPPTLAADYLNSGSIWHEPNEWMMALKLKERQLATFWQYESGSIEVIANSVGSNQGWVMLQYEFPNFKACKTELDNAIY
jgi:hypothetical protein